MLRVPVRFAENSCGENSERCFKLFFFNSVPPGCRGKRRSVTSVVGRGSIVPNKSTVLEASKAVP